MIVDYNPSLPQDKVFLFIRHNTSFCSGNYAKMRGVKNLNHYTGVNLRGNRNTCALLNHHSKNEEADKSQESSKNHLQRTEVLLKTVGKTGSSALECHRKKA